MTALTKNKPRAIQTDNSNGLPLVAGAMLYEGSAVGRAAGADGVRALVSGDTFVGFAAARADNRAGALGAQTARLVSRGEVELVVAGAVASSLGASVYATDDDTFTLTVGGSAVGTVKRVPAAGTAIVAFDALLPSLTFSEAAAVRAAGGVEPAAAYSAMQEQLNTRQALHIPPGAYTLSECMLLGNDTQVVMQPGAQITASGTYQHTMLRTGNAEFASSTGALPGVSILCADEATESGTGTLRYTHSGTTLAWLAPGESAYGTGVDISGVSSVATTAVFALPAASSGKQLYVYVTTAAARNADMTRTVRVEPVTGARAMTWTRASNVRTVTEAAHGRRIGDPVICFGPSGDVSHGFITGVTASTYTLADTGSDQASAQTGRVYGVRAVRIVGRGAALDFNKAGLSTGLMSNLHAIVMQTCADPCIEDLEVNNATKYAVYFTGCKSPRASNIRSFRVDSSTTAGNSDTVHFAGPCIDIRATDIRAQGGDNIVALGCCDYNDYTLFLPGYGTVSIDGYEVGPVYGENTHQHPVRVFNANSGTISGGRIGPVLGTYSTDADACVAVISDASASQIDAGATNITGLVVVSPDAVRVDGSVSSAFVCRGAGTRRGLRVEGMRARSFSSSSAGCAWFEDCVVDDAHIEAYGAGSFSGAVIALTGTGTIKALRAIGYGLVWDNAKGSGQRGAFVLLNNASAVLNFADLTVSAIDSSASGNKASVLWQNNGTTGRVIVCNTRFQAGTDAIARLSNGTCGTLQLVNIEHEGSYLVACDVGFSMLDCTNVYHFNGASAAIQWNVAGSSTPRIRVNNLRASNRFIRNVQGNATYLLEALQTEISSTVFLIDAGTPALRLQGPTDLTLDGSAALDATVGNHAAGAGFYNSNAAFVSGVGAYVRGATAWVRVAA